MFDAPNPWVAIVVSIVGAFIAIATFFRNGGWRKSDEAKALRVEIAALGNRIGNAERSAASAEANVADIGGIKDRLTRLETQLMTVATKEDIAGLNGSLGGIRDLVIRAEHAVDRVERILMEKA